MSRKRIAIIGAGPIGLEAALAALALGYDVRVYERGSVAENLKRWGHVKLFSPFRLNHSERGLGAIRRNGGDAAPPLPHPEDYLTGAEHAKRYLLPLSQYAPLARCLREGTRVVSMGRESIGKTDLIGGPREDYRFRLLVERASGEERLTSADIVLDCSGTYGRHNWMGNGSVPAMGERRLEGHIDYELRDILGRDRVDFERRRVLVVGSGHSAATALDALTALDGTKVSWVSRRRDPLQVIDNDPLPERKRLSELTRALAFGLDDSVAFFGGYNVERIELGRSGFEVLLRSGDETKRLTVDRVLAHVGYQPDASIYRELQVHECYATLAPMKLAATLLGQSSPDCLARESPGADSLANPEPDFFILGAKSFGRTSNFLIRVGLQQIDEVFGMLARRRAAERAS